MTCTASLSPVVEYHGLGGRLLMRRGLLVRPQLNAGTLGGRGSGNVASRTVWNPPLWQVDYDESQHDDFG